MCVFEATSGQVRLRKGPILYGMFKVLDWTISYKMYCPRSGLRKVYPYYFTFTTFTKGRWVGEKILDVFAREFRAHPVEEYVSNLDNLHPHEGI